MHKILIIEDDQNISRLIQYNLTTAGFQSIVVDQAEKAFPVLIQEKINLIILDIMLPNMDGYEFCKTLKQEQQSKIPIIMLTARGEEIDRITGFESGADDYVVKPFSPQELVLRVKAIFKRDILRETIPEKLIINELIIDITNHIVSINHQNIELTFLEFKLLVLLIQRKGIVQSRDKLLNDVWGINVDITTRTVDTHIKRLRQKLAHYGKLIETVRNVGYRFLDNFNVI